MEIRVAHIATVDEEELLAILGRHLWFADKAVYIDQFGVGLNIY